MGDKVVIDKSEKSTAYMYIKKHMKKGRADAEFERKSLRQMKCNILKKTRKKRAELLQKGK